MEKLPTPMTCTKLKTKINNITVTALNILIPASQASAFEISAPDAKSTHHWHSGGSYKAYKYSAG